MIEDSGILFTNEYVDSSQFKYRFKTDLEPDKKYSLVFSYETEHGYEETLDPIVFLVSVNIGGNNPFIIQTAENSDIEINHTHPLNEKTDDSSIAIKDNIDNILSLDKDEEEGRIGLKIHDPRSKVFNGNLCIRRTDSKSNFTKWEDIKIINIIQTSVDDLEVFYDYTIESGVWYKYAIQEISINGVNEVVRGQMGYVTQPVMRNFNHSYLLGENGVQLKLKYNNEMNNFKINNSEGRLDTLGSIYPFITRNGNTNYKSFPVNGLITFNMDDMHTFVDDKDIYNIDTLNIEEIYKEEIVNLYKEHNVKNYVEPQYDYIYEKFFRDKVLKFLYDGKPKLFKSATEGNILIRLMDINTAPTQSLGRLTYSFSATGYETAAAAIENYDKYHLIDLGKPIKDFIVTELNIGQVIGDFKFGENIFDKIWEKYDSGNKNIAGYSYKIKTIKNLEIEINSKPLIIKNSAGELVLGNNFSYNNNIITIYGTKQKYNFDPLITFNKDSNVNFLSFDESDSNNKIESVNLTINFLYEYEKKPYQEKLIKNQTIVKGIGQYYENTLSKTSIYRIIYYKYYRNWETKFCRLDNLSSINIEANPGCVFRIRDNNDKNNELHEVGLTGVLNLTNISNISEIIFEGIRDYKTKEIITNNVYSDILIDYNYILTKGEYVNGS